MKVVMVSSGWATGLLAPSIATGLTIALDAPDGIDPQALSGFHSAAFYWSTVLADDVEVRLAVDFTSLPAGVLGSTRATYGSFEVSDVFSALSSDVTSDHDLIATSHFPSLNNETFLSFITQTNTEGGSTSTSLDNDTSIVDPVTDENLNSAANNNRFLVLTTANAKAIGWQAPDPTASDGSITFSSGFSWDFDPTDGIEDGRQDFVGVAIHEIGHALGFVSGVDVVDQAIDLSVDLDPYAVFSILDMYRYSSDGTLNLAAGVESYFSLDGGTTSLATFSTGVSNGDGWQASHWKDDQNYGLMDPTANPAGQSNSISQLDLLAFDVIGWDLQLSAIPEPTSTLAIGLLLASSLGFRRRTPTSR